MRVLGIDPGTRIVGYGVVEERSARPLHVGHGVIRTDGRAPLEHRLAELFAQLSIALAQFKPDAVAVEGVFCRRNARSALILGHARGVALLVAAQRGIPVHEYSPARVKRAVGAGGADGKDAVGRMVSTWLGLPEVKPADASDALAVAMCHLNHCRPGPGIGPLRGGQGAVQTFADRLKPAFIRAPEVER